MKAVTITYIMSHFKTTLHTWFTLKYIPKNQSVHIQKYRHISHSSQLDFCHKFSFIQRKATVVLFFFFQRGSINYNFKLYVQWLAGFLFYFFSFFCPSLITVPRESTVIDLHSSVSEWKMQNSTTEIQMLCQQGLLQWSNRYKQTLWLS